MIFKSSYIITENNGLLRCEPVIGRRQIVALGLAAVASVAAGVIVFSMLSASLPAANRVAWTLAPKAVKTATHVVPGGPIVMTTARVVPSTLQTADERAPKPHI